MTTCVICRFDTELDDVVVRLPSGRCVCLSCYDRETGNAPRPAKSLRRSVEDAMAGR